MNYRFHRAAVAEHLDQVAFYESRLPGLGADYLAEFEAVMSRICIEPACYPTVGTLGIRKAGLKRFPFHVIYQSRCHADRCTGYCPPTPPTKLLDRAGRVGEGN